MPLVAYQGQGTSGRALDPAVQIQIPGSISPTIANTVYPVITISNDAFLPAQTQIEVFSTGNFSASLYDNTPLPVGTYPGTMTLAIYADAGHTQPYKLTGNVLQYTYEVLPMLSVTAKDNGTGTGTAMTSYEYNGSASITSGDTLELDANVASNWVVSGVSNCTVTPGTTSTTAWTGVITKNISADSASFYVTVVSQDPTQQGVLVHVTVN